MKTVYHFALKRFAIREIFEDVVDYLPNLGDVDIQEHLDQSSSHATYISKTAVDEYLTFSSDYLKDGLLSHLITTSDCSMLTDEITDISHRAEVATFVRYIDSDSCNVKEEFLGLVQIRGNKSTAQLNKKITKIFCEKGIVLGNIQFSSLEGTNSMSGKIAGLQ